MGWFMPIATVVMFLVWVVGTALFLEANEKQKKKAEERLDNRFRIDKIQKNI